MFKNLGKIKYKKETNKIQINLNDLKDDINFTEEFIIYKNKNNLNIYDRICDHNSGKLISKDNKTFCPMHNWEFLPKKGCSELVESYKPILRPRPNILIYCLAILLACFKSLDAPVVISN